MGHDAQETDAAAAVDFKEVQSTERFQELRKRHRSFVFPMTVSICWQAVQKSSFLQLYIQLLRLVLEAGLLRRVGEGEQVSVGL